jgi:hypothetical protein
MHFANFNPATSLCLYQARVMISCTRPRSSFQMSFCVQSEKCPDVHHLLSIVSIKTPIHRSVSRGGSRGWGRTRRAPPPLKLEKIWFFGVKPWFFTRNTPKFFAPPSARRNFFKCAPPSPNLKSWIRPWSQWLL